MAETGKSERENLAALEALRSAAEPPRGKRPPAPAATGPGAEPVARRPARPDIELVALDAGPAPNSPAPTPRTATAPAEPGRYRCLHCGYRLLTESGFRCSECGREYDLDDLEYWYAGGEQERLQRVLWLVRAILFLKLWIISELFGIARFAAAGAALWACIIANQGRTGTLGGHFSVAGIFAAGLLLLMGPFSAVGGVTLELCTAGLLLAAMFYDPRSELYGAGAARLAGLATVVAAPLLAVAWLALETARSAGPPLAVPGYVAGGVQFAYGLPYAITFVVWVVVWRRLEGLNTTLFRGVAPSP